MHTYTYNSYYFCFCFGTHVLSLFFGFPARVASGTQVDVIYVDLVVANVNNLARRIFGICSAIWVGAQDGIVARERGIKLRVFIDDVAKTLIALIDKRFTDANVARSQFRRFVATFSAVIDQLIWVVCVDANVIHILAYATEMHVINYIFI